MMIYFESILQIWIILIGFRDANDCVNLGICKHEFKFTCCSYCRFTLRGRVVTKGREITIFAKSQPPFDVHQQYLDVSLTGSQARVSRFRCRIFHCFVDFSKI